MKTQYENKCGSAQRYTERLVLCTVVVGDTPWQDPVPKSWPAERVAADMLGTWGSGTLTKTLTGWQYVTDDPEAKERHHAAD